MPRILVTGGNGVLGRELAPRLVQAGHTVRVMSRQPRPAAAAPELEWAQVELSNAAGLPEALARVDTVVHAASSPVRDTQQVDVDGTRHLLQAARRAGVRHVVYISIVGIDRLPLPYYQYKLAAEALIQAGGVPWTILRTTQFFELLDVIFRRAARYPLMFLPKDFRFQPLAAAEAAEALVRAVEQGPSGRLPDMAGPELKTAGELAAAWLAAQHNRRRVFHLPMFGKVAAGYRAGLNTAPDRAVGRQRWAEWLAHKYARAAAGDTDEADRKRRTAA